MPVLLRRASLLLLWTCGLWPLVLLALFAGDPLQAVQTQILLETAARTAALALLLLAVVLTLVYPPFPAGVRYGFARVVGGLRRERGPLRRAREELRHFESAARQLEAGRAALAAGEPDAALPHLERTLELDAEQPQARYLQGQALLELGRPADAIAALQQSVALEPGHAFGSPMLLLGRACLLAGEPAAAAEWLARHSREHGGNRKSHYWLGLARRAAGDRDGALAAFRVAAAPPPDKPRLTAEEAFYRARARVALWGAPKAAPAGRDRDAGGES